MLEIGGTIVFNSGPEEVKGESACKLAFKLAAGSAELEVLLGIKLGNISEPKLAEGTECKVEGKVDDAEEEDTKLRELVPAESKGDCMSDKEAGKFETDKLAVGKLESGKFEAPAGKGAL